MRPTASFFRNALCALTLLLLMTTMASAKPIFNDDFKTTGTYLLGDHFLTAEFATPATMANFTTTATDFDDIGRPQNNQFNLTAMCANHHCSDIGDALTRPQTTQNFFNLNVRIHPAGHRTLPNFLNLGTGQFS